jgi:hypothetical protein
MIKIVLQEREHSIGYHADHEMSNAYNSGRFEFALSMTDQN